ncbi:MFS transporter [Pontitalea aquivivens]|uniref:MFS transporter n=1 Tax=Pontitalea aquivivens TaxID=3388663 RepID=UPI003970B173
MSERRVALLGGLLAGLGPLSLALFTPAMPVMAANYGTTDAAVKATLSVYFAGYAGAQLVSGPLSDRYGRRPMILIFLIVYLIGTCGALLATGIKIMLLSRAVQGIGAAAGLVMSRAIVRDVFTGDTSARVLNVSNIILGAGPAVAPAIGGAAMLVAGWRAPFVMMLLIGCVVILAASRWLIETRPPQTPASGVFTTYLTLLRDPYFLWSALTIAGTVGTFYA